MTRRSPATICSPGICFGARQSRAFLPVAERRRPHATPTVAPATSSPPARRASSIASMPPPASRSGRAMCSRRTSWKISFWGVSASPLVFEDTVVVTGGLTKGPTLFAYRKSTGEPLWHSGTDKASYASPILATLAGRRVILSVNAASLTAHDPATGAQLLDYPWGEDKWPKPPNPWSSRIIASSSPPGTASVAPCSDIQTAPEGKLTATPVWKKLAHEDPVQQRRPARRISLRVGRWPARCVDIATGERKWKDGHFGSGQTLLADGPRPRPANPPRHPHRARPDGYKELGRLPALNAKTWNHPTLAGRYLLVRNSEEMACYELPLLSHAATPPTR